MPRFLVETTKKCKYHFEGSIERSNEKKTDFTLLYIYVYQKDRSRKL